MANYLVAKCGNTTSSYSLQDIEPSSKPYLRVSNSYLPLTTETKTGLQVKANNNIYAVGVETKSTTTTLTSPVYMKIGSSETSLVEYSYSCSDYYTWGAHETYTITSQSIRYYTVSSVQYGEGYVPSYTFIPPNKYTTTMVLTRGTRLIGSSTSFNSTNCNNLYMSSMTDYLVTDSISSYYYSNHKTMYEFESNNTINIEMFKTSINRDYSLQTNSTIGYYNSRQYITNVVSSINSIYTEFITNGTDYNNFTLSLSANVYYFNSSISDLYISYNTSSNSNNGYTVTMPGILTTISSSTTRKYNSYTTTVAKYVGSITIASSSFDSYPIGYQSVTYSQSARVNSSKTYYKLFSKTMPGIVIYNNLSSTLSITDHLTLYTYISGNKTISYPDIYGDGAFRYSIPLVYYTSSSTRATCEKRQITSSFTDSVSILNYYGFNGEPVRNYIDISMAGLQGRCGADFENNYIYNSMTNKISTHFPTISQNYSTIYAMSDSNIEVNVTIGRFWNSSTIILYSTIPIPYYTSRTRYTYTEEFDAYYTNTSFFTTANTTLYNGDIIGYYATYNYVISSKISWLYTNSAYISIGSKPITKTITVQ